MVADLDAWLNDDRPIGMVQLIFFSQTGRQVLEVKKDRLVVKDDGEGMFTCILTIA